MSAADAADGAAPRALFENRARASSFGENAELYDATRPHYPDALVEDLVGLGATRVLDVGCGTGILGRAFVERGCAVTGVEPDERMAAVAARHGIAVELATFEDWDAAGRRFDLAVAGQSWHWVDPVRGASKAAEVLEVGGHLALIWNDGRLDAALQAALDEVYARLTPDRASPTVVHRPEEWRRPGGSEQALEAEGAFGPLEHRTYAWERRYTTDAWLAQLETHSDHRLLAPDERATLLAAVADVLDAQGGAFTMSYDCRATIAPRVR